MTALVPVRIVILTECFVGPRYISPPQGCGSGQIGSPHFASLQIPSLEKCTAHPRTIESKQQTALPNISQRAAQHRQRRQLIVCVLSALRAELPGGPSGSAWPFLHAVGHILCLSKRKPPRETASNNQHKSHTSKRVTVATILRPGFH